MAAAKPKRTAKNMFAPDHVPGAGTSRLLTLDQGEVVQLDPAYPNAVMIRQLDEVVCLTFADIQKIWAWDDFQDWLGECVNE